MAAAPDDVDAVGHRNALSGVPIQCTVLYRKSQVLNRLFSAVFVPEGVSELVLTVLADLLDVGAACLDEAAEVPGLGPAAVCHTGHPGCSPLVCHTAQ